MVLRGRKCLSNQEQYRLRSGIFTPINRYPFVNKKDVLAANRLKRTEGKFSIYMDKKRGLIA